MPADTRRSDKLRIIAGPKDGARAIVERVHAKTLLVRLTDSNQVISVAPNAVTNFSAAARKAWKTMPDRRVGRPRGQTINRISVTLRIDRAIWGRFRALESAGTISDRSDFIEAVLTYKLGRLEAHRK